MKLAVSGCPRNCAEATCKDVGIICVDSGYQIGVGGAAGMDVKETEPLVKVATEEEAIDTAPPSSQLYRENAKYLDRPYKWIAKVGLDWVNAQVRRERRPRRCSRRGFELSQSIYQKDPWAERAAQQEARFDADRRPDKEAAE